MATLLYIESGVVLALAIWMVALAISHSGSQNGTEMAPFIGVVVFALLGSTGLFLAGRGYAQGKSFGRAPSVLANLIAVGVAYFQVQGGFYLGAVLILTLALPTLVTAIKISIDENR
jgi:hypothetical protein